MNDNENTAASDDGDPRAQIKWTCRSCMCEELNSKGDNVSRWCCKQCGEPLSPSEATQIWRQLAQAAREKAAKPDQFRQLEQAIAQHEDGSQLALEFDGGDRIMPLVKDIALDVIRKQIDDIRDFAAARGEKLLFQNLACEHCGSTEVVRELGLLPPTEN